MRAQAGKVSGESLVGRHGSSLLCQLHVRVIGSNKAALENAVMDLKPLWESPVVIYEVLTRSRDNASARLTC